MLSQRKMLDSSGDQDLIFPPSNACGRQDQVYHSLHTQNTNCFCIS